MQVFLLTWTVLIPLASWFFLSIFLYSFGISVKGPEPAGSWQGASYGFLMLLDSWVREVGNVFMWPGEALTGFGDEPTGEQVWIEIGVSAVLWSWLLPWGLNVFGMWDWFGTKFWPGSSGSLSRWWVGFRDWIEEVLHFGKGPVAKWASMADMRANRWERGDVFLGRPWTKTGGAPWPVGLATEKHMVTIAGTGSGKSTAALIPNICLHPGGLLCIDPKGELARVTAGRRRRMKAGPVHVLDPFGISGKGTRDCYNPFDDMAIAAAKNPERVVSFAAKMAEALVKPLSTTDSYWDKAAKTLITGLIVYVFAHEPEERRSLVRVRELLTEGDVEGYESAVEAEVFDRKELSAFDFLIEKMRSLRRGPYGEAIARAAGSVAMMGEGQRGSVLTTAQEHTAWIDNPLMARVVGTGGMSILLDDFKDRSLSVYVCLPVTAVTGSEGRFLRLFVLMLIEIMMADPNRVPEIPVLLAVDEFPNLGHLDGIELVAPMMRSYGVRFWAVGQDISQFKEAYPQTWTGFIGGAEAVQFMGINHPPTVDFIVDLLGCHMVERRVGGVPRRDLHPLMDRDQVMRFLAKERGNQIVWFGSRRHMRLKICPYWAYMMPRYYDLDPRFKERGWRWLLRRMGG